MFCFQSTFFERRNNYKIVVSVVLRLQGFYAGSHHDNEPFSTAFEEKQKKKNQRLRRVRPLHPARFFSSEFFIVWFLFFLSCYVLRLDDFFY